MLNKEEFSETISKTINEKSILNHPFYHSSDEMEAIVNNCKTEEEQNKVLDVVKQSTALYWQMLEGMYLN